MRTVLKTKHPTKTAIARDLGARIDAHLRHIEADPKLNPSKRLDKKWIADPMGVRNFYGGQAKGDRHRVWVIYVTYQGGRYLPIEDAMKYLGWLDAGNVGQHYRALQEMSK